MLFGKIRSKIHSSRECSPEAGYNIWAATYDIQPENLMLAADEEIFSQLILNTNFRSKDVVDIGCGTGRHWEKIFAQAPSSMHGFDVSQKMLDQLRKKYSDAKLDCVRGHLLNGLEEQTCDIIISTLTIAHIKDMPGALTEWNRILRKGGQIIITDYHPDMLQKGADRSFSYNGKRIAIRNYVHTLADIYAVALKGGLSVEMFLTKLVDDAVLSWYRRQNALHVFEKYKGTPLIYGLILTK